MTGDHTAIAEHAAALALEVPLATLVEHLPRWDQVPSEHQRDVVLATACVLGDRGALARLDAGWLAPLTNVVARAGVPLGARDEVVQRVRAKLLTAPPDALPRLASYAGTAPLAAWLRVVATREAVSEQRARWRELPLESALASGIADDAQTSPETAAMRAQHRELIRTSVQVAVTTLPADARTLLRYYYCDGLTADEIGRVYRVHASSISRRLAAARAQILEATQRGLDAALTLDSSGRAGLLALAASIDASLSRLLGTPGKSTG